jgi:hypothetical protein
MDMFKELKTLNAILNSYKTDKNILVLASKSNENENLVYIILFLDFKKVKEMKIFRIELDLGNVFYVLTDRKKFIDDIVLAMEMGLNIRELNPSSYQTIVELIGEINELVRKYEENLKSKTKMGI